MDAYQEFVATDWWRSRAFHICRNEAVSQKQCAVLVRIGVKTLHWVGRRISDQHVGSIKRTSHTADVQMLLGDILQIEGGIVSVCPGANLGPVGK